MPPNIAIIPAIPEGFTRSLSTIVESMVVQNICVDERTAATDKPARSIPTRKNMLATPSDTEPFITAIPDTRYDHPDL